MGDNPSLCLTVLDWVTQKVNIDEPFGKTAQDLCFLSLKRFEKIVEMGQPNAKQVRLPFNFWT